jgi:hypothetical protein
MPRLYLKFFILRSLVGIIMKAFNLFKIKECKTMPRDNYPKAIKEAGFTYRK